MNQRIKELAEQAGYTEGYYESDDGPFIEPEFNKEKFAQLIVGECTAIMHKDTSPNCPYVDYFKVTNEIKQHFGVEE